MGNYWKECISEALDEAGLTATEKQVDLITEHVEGAHENHGMATGNYIADSNFITDDTRKLQELMARAEAHDDWVNSTDPCKNCYTKGTVTDRWGRDTACGACNGKGRIRK